ncbi:MAG TPA: acetylglutamate kinase [Polyangia bacterium]|nr:acetylglutamate kinase [Polyangia bacterium]
MSRVVLKLGGDVLAPPKLETVADDVARARAAGHRLVIVHGGGPQATDLSKRLGIEPRLVGGRRVTDGPTLDVVKMVVAGKLNVDLVAALRAAGVPAVGVSGASGVIRAHRRPPKVVSGGGAEPIDFGFVGDVDDFDVEYLSAIEAAGRAPVLACLGADARGAPLNINADVVASQLAAALAADALVACTAVGGVRRDKDDPSSRLARLTVAEAKAAIVAATIQGGMIPKVEEAFAPLEAGVAAVLIVGPGEMTESLASPGSAGTWLVRG